MNQKILKGLLPLALALFAAGPATAQVRMRLGLGPIEVRVAPDDPPPMRYEEPYAQPGPDHVWIGGYWDREGDRWAWRGGRWERPERRGDRWIQPVYRREHGGTRYEAGHWSGHKVHEGQEYQRWHKQHGRD